MTSFKVSDETVNSYGIRVLSSGGDFSQFEKNPIMLYDHDDYKRLPIGNWENLRTEGEEIFADPVFDDDDPFALSVKKKVEKKIIRMCSMGIIPLEWSDDLKLMLPGQDVAITKWILREISITPFGSNKNAFKLYDKQGNIINLNENTTFFKSNQKTNKMNDTKDNLKEVLCAGLNLSDSTSDSEMLRHVLKLSTDNASLTQQLATMKQEKENAEAAVELKEKTDFLNLAQKQKKFTADQRASYEKMEFKDLKVVLGDVKPTIDLSEVPGSDKAGKSPWETRMDEIQKK
jgi:HK97 family phage prohead protease